MGGNSGSSFTCKHDWKTCNGVCPSCLAEKLVSITFFCEDKNVQSCNTDSNQTCESCYEDTSTYFPVDASVQYNIPGDEFFPWERSKSVGKAGLQPGTHPKVEFFCDTAEDDQGLCLVSLDSGIIDRGHYSQGKNFMAAEICRKDDGAFAGHKAHCSRSSQQMDRSSKSGNKLKLLWAPTAIVRKLFSNKKATKDPTPTQHECEERSCLSPPHVMGLTAPEGICKSSSLKEMGSLESFESDARDPQRSEAEKIHPLRRVMPVTSTSCYDRITDAMRHDHPSHKFPYQSCSKDHSNQLGSSSSRAVWSKAMGSPLKIFTKKSSSKSQGKEQSIDLEKHFKGATSSWSKFSSLMDPERRLCYQSPAHTAFHKDHNPSSFRSSPMRRCRRRKTVESRHGIFHLSPYSLGNDGWNCYLSPMTNRRSSPLKSRLI